MLVDVPMTKMVLQLRRFLMLEGVRVTKMVIRLLLNVQFTKILKMVMYQKVTLFKQKYKHPTTVGGFNQ